MELVRFCLCRYIILITIKPIYDNRADEYSHFNTSEDNLKGLISVLITHKEMNVITDLFLLYQIDKKAN